MFIQKVFLGPTGDPPLSDLSRTDVLFKLSPICPSYLFNYSTILCTGHVVIYNTRFWYSRCGSYNILHIHTVNTIVYSMIKQHTIGYIMIIHEIRHHPQLYWFLEWNFLSDPGLSTGPIYGSSLSVTKWLREVCETLLMWLRLMKIPTQY